MTRRADIVFECSVGVVCWSGETEIAGAHAVRVVAEKAVSEQQTQTSTSLSSRTFVRLQYDPWANTLMLRLDRVALAVIALRTAVTALSHVGDSVHYRSFRPRFQGNL